MAVECKKVCLANVEKIHIEENVNEKHLIYVVPQKIQKRRLEILLTNSSRKGFNVADKFSFRVTHVVSACDNCDQVLQFLNVSDDHCCQDMHFVSTLWLSECLKCGKIVDVERQHHIPKAEKVHIGSCDSNAVSLPLYECQRATPLRHHNEHITHAFEVLAREADFKNDDVNYSRALAFRRAACVFKCLPSRLKDVDEIRNIHNIGKHMTRIVEDIIDNGFSSEAETIENSDWYKTMTTFTGVFGVGPATAGKWYKLGLRTIDNLKKEVSLPYKDERISVGLAFYQDLMLPVMRSEAEALLKFLHEKLNTIVPGSEITLTGGFRRGKDSGHDIDFLLSHPEEGKEQELLPELLQQLDRLGMVIYGKRESSTWNDSVLQDHSVKGQSLRSTLDHFEKWIGILKLDKRYRSVDSSEEAHSIEAMQSKPEDCPIGKMDGLKMAAKRKSPAMRGDEIEDDRSWHARRVDLIVTPASQFYYALVGWTGSKHFNRSLRLYAQRELNLRLSSHALYDPVRKCALPAETEEEVFENLHLPCFKPTERNC